ncbi:secreted RxLR effector protein 161-like [Rutidosis leptorrhynchoides]|uniref:secreted RxLR effector protein 161-like n=1 Tax=Rutidosis leptorrhynchoides TaxID=125765 RepID=UPI003A99E380
MSKKIANEILERFELLESNDVCNPMTTGFKVDKDENGVKVDVTQYKQMIGSLMYLSAIVRTSFTLFHGQENIEVRERYQHNGIFYMRGGSCEFLGFTDNDYVGDTEDMRSNSGYMFMLSRGAVE